MPRRARQLSASGIYHVLLRGVNRDAIFLEVEDFERFLHALRLTKESSGCLVLAYCLMTNHVHLVLRATGEPVGATVQRLGIRYAGWFNHKYGRVGHLFQDRFKSLPVDTDEYIATLIRYVWENPVAAGLTDRPEDYQWSSRRLLGLPSRVVDEDELRRLLGADALREIASATPPGQATARVVPAPFRHTDAEVADLLREMSGAENPSEFQDLGIRRQRIAVRELRTRAVPYAQIARATGVSPASVRRMHLAADDHTQSR